MSSQHPEQQAEQAADQLPAHREEDRVEQPIARQGMFGARTTGDTSGFGGLVVRQSPRISSPRPYGGPRGADAEGEFDEVADQLERAYPEFGDAIERVVVDRGELTFVVRRTHLVEVARVLRDDPKLRFELCTGVSGVHYPEDAGAELHAVYPLLSMTHNRRVRLEVTCPDADPHVPSIMSVYPTNDWHERETYDFFGLVFDGHPALTRIMMPDDWMGHPQRKDYPLGGIPVEYRGATVPPPDERRSYV
jgi:NADH-quinone oxidoreductase subunit C